METSFARNELLKKVLENKEICEIINKENLDLNVVDKNLNCLLSYDLKIVKCKSCRGLETCLQASTGYQPIISYNGTKFEIDYAPCKYLKEGINKSKKLNNLQIISSDFSMFNFENVFVNEERQKVLLKIKKCINNYEKGTYTKGLYIHGQYGSGKTYLLAYIAKNLADLGHKVIFAYYPDLARKMKSAISSGELEDIIEELKEVEVLALDDFGGEMLTSFIRDEVIGSILQHRMSNNLLTFASSNLNEKFLMSHLQETNRDIDEVRASRIFERIRALMEFVELKDDNYRK